MPIFHQNYGPLEKPSFSTFWTFCFYRPHRPFFFFLEYRETHFPGLFFLKYKNGKIANFYQRVSMGLTDRRKKAKNLVDSRKNWKIIAVSRK